MAIIITVIITGYIFFFFFFRKFFLIYLNYFYLIPFFFFFFFPPNFINSLKINNIWRRKGRENITRVIFQKRNSSIERIIFFFIERESKILKTVCG